MDSATTLLTTALAWQQAGASVIPVKPDGTKRPAIPWKRYQTVPATAAQIKTWWADETAGIGLICGAVSGGLELLELEGRAVKENILTALATAFADHDKADLWARIAAGYIEVSPSGGIHYIYRVDGEPKPNTKLARRPATDAEKAANPGAQVEVLIETRGEGGYVVVAPTPGTCHPSGRGWVAITGTPDTVATITADERDAIHAIAATCDQMPHTPTPVARALPAPVAPGEGGRPGDAFNAAASWDDILTPAGWQRVRRDGQGWDWVRPGKKAADGISATTGTATDGVDRLYVFTTSTDFDTERPYDKFSAWSVLNTGGNMSEAARQLAAQGYGDQPTIEPPPPITFNGATITPRTPTGPALATDGSAALAPVVDIDQARDRRQAIGRNFTDRDNADLMTARHRDRLRYIPSRHTWMAWDGTRWAIADDNAPAIQAAIDTLDAITIPTDDTKAFTAWQRSYGRARLEAMTALASTMPALRVDADRLDADGMALNTPAGLVNLADGTIRPGTHDDLCTRTTTVAPDDTCPTPRWDKFLDDTFQGDRELIGFVQRLAGYSSMGVVSHHILPFLHGAGGNGKSVMLDVLVQLLGDYATTAPANFLMTGRSDESAIARLSGQRLVVCSEIDQSARFDEAKVKLITGGDKLTARFLYGQFFTFTPSHHLWLMGNHQPRVEAGGESFWRRLRLVPFNVTVPKLQRIERLAQIMADEEGPGILAWIITGAVTAHRDGLAEPAAVMAATAEYESEEDALGRFFADRCKTAASDQAKVKTSELRQAYEAWCRDAGEAPMSSKALTRELRSRWGIDTAKGGLGVRFYSRVTLLADPDEPDRELTWSDR